MRELGQQLLEPGAARGAVGLGDLEDGEDVLLDRQAAEDRHLLRQVAEAEPGAAVHGQRGDVEAVDHHLPALGRDEAGDGVEAGGLAAAVGAEQRHHLAGGEVHRDVADHRAPPVATCAGAAR